MDTTTSFIDIDDQLLFPVYDQGTGSLSPESETLSSPSISDYPTPTTAPLGHPLVAEPPHVAVVPADDSVVRHEPSRHVDYLSHDWKEEDIWASWRYMVGKRKVYSNAARLENASWRTWAKSKFKLRTVSPETLNWLKDCDVTWLYGPLSTGNQKSSLLVDPPSPTASPTESRLRTSGSFLVKKPILKKRSMSEVMLQRSLSNSSLLKQAAAAIESQQSGLSRPAMVSRANSDFSTYFQDSKSTSAISTKELPSALSTGSQSPSCAKHIHFNDQVQQCIAVDKDEEDEDEDDVFEVENVEDSSSDEDGLIMMPKKGSNKLNSRGSISDHQTIAMLPSTTLKAVEEVVEVKKSDTFSNIGSFFSSFGASSTEAKATDKLEGLAAVGTKSYILEDDDEDMAELDWEPSHSSFATRRDSVAITQDRFGSRGFGASTAAVEDEDFELPNYTHDEDEDDETAAGLFGRAVDAVNTARDIAHVLWNVGWSR